jgi:hypothetical protein
MQGIAMKKDTECMVGGKTFRLSMEQVIKKLRGTKPGPIQAHVVEIDGTDYPVKEVFAKATGLDLLDFNTNQARSVLKRLGFVVKRA